MGAKFWHLRARRGASPVEDGAKSAECLIAFTAATAPQLGETQAQTQEALSLQAVVKLSFSLSLGSSSMKECVSRHGPIKHLFWSRCVRFTPLVKPVTPSTRVNPSGWHGAHLIGADTLLRLRLISEDEAAVDESREKGCETAGFVQTNSVFCATLL